MKELFLFNLFLLLGSLLSKGKNKILALAEVMKHFCVESRLAVSLWIIGDFDDAMTHKALIRF